MREALRELIETAQEVLEFLDQFWAGETLKDRLRQAIDKAEKEMERMS